MNFDTYRTIMPPSKSAIDQSGWIWLQKDFEIADTNYSRFQREIQVYYITVESPVSDLSKCKAKVVVYWRWLLMS